MRRAPPLIVGGGPAGTVAAIALAQAGVRPVILERSREDEDALCGGFLSAPTCAALAHWGVDVAALGARPVTRLRLVAGPRCVELALPAVGVGLSRRALDRALRAAAEARGAGIERGVAVRRIGVDLAVHLADGSTLPAAAVILATGKHDVHGLVRPRIVDPTLGLRARLPGNGALAGTIELHLFEGGYAGLVLQEDGSTNLCMAVRHSRLRESDDNPARLIAALAAESPHFAARIAGGLGRVDAVAQVPYGWRAAEGTPGLYRIGDQAGVIPSLAGEGIGIAIASGAFAARSWQDGMSAEAFQPLLAARTRRPIAAAGLLWRLAEHPRAGRLAARAIGIAPALLAAAFAATRMRH